VPSWYTSPFGSFIQPFSRSKWNPGRYISALGVPFSMSSISQISIDRTVISPSWYSRSSFESSRDGYARVVTLLSELT